MEKVPQHRIAPSPESSESAEELKFDVVVVIPAMDEGLNIINTIHSIATQKSTDDNKNTVGIVIVINSRPNVDQSVKSANLQTYTLLQGITYQKKISSRTNPDLAQKVEDIINSGVTIKVIDAFSDSHSSETNNVGMARRIGTEEAIKAVHPSGSIISTDADTTLGPEVLMTIREVFSEHQELDAFPLRLKYDLETLPAEERRIFYRYHTYNKLITNLLLLPKITQATQTSLPFPDARAPQPAYLEEVTSMPGAGTVFRPRAYTESGGYTDIGTTEDITLASDMIKAGMNVANIGVNYPKLFMYTQPRVSTRTEKGLGHTFQQWSDPEYLNTYAPSEENEILLYDILESINTLHKQYREDSNRSQEILIEVSTFFDGYSPETTEKDNLMQLFIAWDGRKSTTEYWNIYLAVEKFALLHCTQKTVSEMVTEVEGLNTSLSDHFPLASVEAKCGLILDNTNLSWQDFNTYADDILSEAKGSMPTEISTEQSELIHSWKAAVYYEFTKDYFSVMKEIARTNNQTKLGELSSRLEGVVYLEKARFGYYFANFLYEIGCFEKNDFRFLDKKYYEYQDARSYQFMYLDLD